MSASVALCGGSGMHKVRGSYVVRGWCLTRSQVTVWDSGTARDVLLAISESKYSRQSREDII